MAEISMTGWSFDGWTVMSPEGYTICTVANCRKVAGPLIAAAPDLRDALKALITRYAKLDDEAAIVPEVIAAFTALAKAEGV